MTISHLLFINTLLATIGLIGGVNVDAQCIIKQYEDVEEMVKSCQDIVIDGVIVPGGEQLQIALNEGSTLTFRGRTTFTFYEWSGPLVSISGNGITVRGESGSLLDGQGQLWWDGQGTWGNVTKPKFFRIQATNALFEGIALHHCPVGCTSVSSSENVTIRNWIIDNLAGDEGVAPTDKFGHNTDGFGISSSRNIVIEDSSVYNQDDCVVFNSGKNITVRNMFCHGSHGFSISVNSSAVEDTIVENSIISMSENGIHVKTHVDAGEGLIRNVLYRNITMLDCKQYGISVEQNYKNLPAGQPQNGPPNNNIPIHNLTLENIFGNVLNGAMPVFVLCAQEGCFDWIWKNVNILGTTENNCTNYAPKGYKC
ncbi:polygalacturonase-like [Euwallacea similis]|uniref:polygalacturonase-like n=1 Tax=Euwallacea similis TaxID=1736056 RepID=UPI00344D50AB